MIFLLGGYLAYSLQISPGDVELVSTQEGAQITLRGGYLEAEPGGPFVPFKLLLFALPPGAQNVRVEAEASGKAFLFKAPKLKRFHPERFNPNLPRVEDLPLAQSIPKKLAQLTGVWSFRGQPVAGVKVWPVALDADSSVFVYQNIEIRLSYDIGSPQPLKITPSFRRLLEALVVNPQDLQGITVPEENYLIIADSVFLPHLEELVRWRRLTGHRVFVMSVQEALRRFSGYDPADAVRNAIKWFYREKAVSFVLLVGNKERVPAKMALVPSNSSYAFGDSIYTDYYYACLDGSWNPDGDWFFADMDEWVDLAPDIFVGRWPVRDTQELLGLIEKTITYEAQPSSRASDLILHASQIYGSGSSTYYANLIRSVVPGWVHEVTLVEDEHPWDITAEELADSINQGAGIFVSICHGNWYFVVADLSARNYFKWTHAQSLSNSAQPSFAMLLSCFYNDLMDMSVGKWALLNPRGGFVATFGGQKEDYADMATLVFDSLLSKLYSGAYYTAGQLDAAARAVFAYAGWSTMWRRLLVSYELGGDPALQLWRLQPQVPQLELPASVSDPCTVRVFLGGLPLAGARVSAITPSGHQRIGLTDTSGAVVFSDFGLEEGTYYFGVRALDAVPVVDSAPGARPQKMLVISGVEAEPLRLGDTSLVVVKLKNLGTITALGALKLAPVDPYLGFTAESLGVFSVDPGQELPCTLAAFLRDTPPNPEDLARFSAVAYTEAETSHIYRGELEVKVPKVEFLGVKAEPQDTQGLVRFEAWFANAGSGETDTLVALIRGRFTTSAVDSVDTLLPLAPGEAYLAQLSARCIPGDTPKVFLYLFSGSELLLVKSLRVASGPPAPALQQFPDFAGAKLLWDTVPDINGYVLLARPSEDTAFKVRVPSLLPQATYTDKEALYPDTFWFKVIPVDTGWRWGQASEEVAATSHPPHQHVPLDFYLATQSWCLPVDLNPYNPGEEGVFTGCDQIELYAVAGDGGVWRAPTGLVGGFTPPAVGDINWDHYMELITADVWNGKIYAFRFNGDPLWSYDAPGIFKNPIMLYNLDADSAPEVIAVVQGTDSSWVVALDGDGSELWKFWLPRKVLNGPVAAVGDFDGNGSADVVVVDADGWLWWIDADGSLHPGYPWDINSSGRGVSVAGGDLFPSYPGDELVALGNTGDIWVVWDTVKLAHVQINDGKNDSYVIVAPVVSDTALNVVVVSDNLIYVLDRQLNILDTVEFPSHLGNPLASDISPEPGRELIAGTLDHGLIAASWQGHVLLGFPIYVADENEEEISFAETPFVADLDRDGLADLHALFRQAAYYSWNLYYPYDPDGWNSFSANRWNTRVYGFKPYDWTIDIDEGEKPLAFSLLAVPSVFKGSLRLTFSLPSATQVKLSVYDLSGRLVKRVVDGRLEAGLYKVSVDLGERAGVFAVELRTPRARVVRKVIKLR